MKIDYDPNKSQENDADRGLPFALAHEFDWESAVVVSDERKQYPESRFQAMGFLKARLHMLVFTPLTDGIRVISLRKANKREVKFYETSKP